MWSWTLNPWSKANVSSPVLRSSSSFLCSSLFTSQHLPEANKSINASFSRLNFNIWAQKNPDSPRMLRVAIMSNSLPNRMSYLPAALPIQISAAQWNLNSTHNCATKSNTVNVSSHYSISPLKYHIIQSIMLWISNNNMLYIAILSFLHKASPLINKWSSTLPVTTGF